MRQLAYGVALVSGLLACGQTVSDAGDDAPVQVSSDAAADGAAPADRPDASAAAGDASTSPSDGAIADASQDATADVAQDAAVDASTPTDASAIDAAPTSFKVHGTLSGVTVDGVVLQNNGGDDLAIAANATTFEFPAPLLDGADFDVAVKSVPSSPMLLVCTVTSGKGKAGPSMPEPSITCVKAHRIFLTSTVYDGNLGGLAGADGKCQARATAAGLGGTWKAILSTRTVDARDHVDGTVARYGVDGTRVMDANKMFSSSNTTGTYPLLSEIRDEFGHAVVGNLFPFAGGGPDGRHAEPSAPYGLGWDDACQDWTSTQGTTTCGYNNVTTGAWLSGCGGIDCKGYVSGVGIHCAED